MFFTIGIVAASANLIGSYRKRRPA
jgi:hypothetical protein